MNFFFAILLIIIIMSLSNKDDKKFFTFFLLIPLSLMLFNITNPDKQNYLNAYNLVASGNFHDETEIGMQVLMFLFSKLHLNYDQFVFVFYIVSILLYIRFMYKWCNRPTVILLLFIVYPMFLDIVQIRTLMATGIALNALEFLKKKTYINAIKYSLLIFLAGTVHYSAFFYLFFLLSYLSVKIVIIIASIAVTIVIVLQSTVIDYILQAFPFLVTQLNRYIYMTISDASIFVLIVSYIINIFLDYLYLNYIKTQKISEEKIEESKIIFKVNVLSICLIPFTFFALEFMRLYRMVMILNYSIAGNVLSFNPNNKKYKVIPLCIIGLVIISCFFSFYRYIYIEHMKDVVQVLFEQNYFWKKVLY